MSKNKGLGLCDLLLILFSSSGAILGLLACVMGYYRQAQPILDSLDWPMRKYYIKKLTDKAMQPTVAWKSLKMDMCSKYQAAQMKYGNPTGMAAAAVMKMTINVPVCGLKPACRESMAERCIFYDYAIDDGLIVMLGNASAFLFAMLGTFCLMVSTKPQWKLYAGCACWLGGFTQLGVISYWMMDTNKYLKRVMQTSVYPYAPMNGWGFYVNLGASLLNLMAGGAGVMSSMFSGKKKSAAGNLDPMMAGPTGGMPMSM